MAKTKRSMPSVPRERPDTRVATREEVKEFLTIYKITSPPSFDEIIKDMKTEFVQNDGHIKRPPNPFLVFRKTANLRAVELGLKSMEQNKFQTKFSKLLGRVWQALSKEEKEGYYKLAEEIKMKHKEQFPLYEFHPKRDKSIFRIYNHTEKTEDDIEESSSVKHVYDYG
ncbi:2658_t:CDS:2 [Ambispora leptoticha]|uniref:2658_t:CDS:1 n=1 Tax=Ambispora leptoticha TaxID=144679 RepID=A0A9N9CPQ7_9GLOM|nr:2658_t:CDS:2 [Ambispora leptoticha]